jgi:hypothetical protein
MKSFKNFLFEIEEEVELDEADELRLRSGNMPTFNKTAAGKAREQKRNREDLKQQMKDTRNRGGLTGPKGKLPEEVELDELKISTLTRYGTKATQALGRNPEKDEKRIQGIKRARLQVQQKAMKKEEVELDEADFSKQETKMAHAIGKEFKKKGVGDSSKGGPFAVATAMVRDKPEAAQKAYKTIMSKTKNEEHQVSLIALYDSLNEENQDLFLNKLDKDFDKLLEFSLSLAEE